MHFYSPNAFGPDVSIGYLARRIHQQSQAALEPVFAGEGLTSVQWSALVAIWFGRRTCAEVARELSYDKGAMTRLADVLEAKGWLTRTRNVGDRRVVTLALTPAGEAVALACRDKVIERWNGWLGDWQGEEVTQLIALLNKLRDALPREESACA